MSQATATTDHAHEHDHHDHPPHLAHHFDTPEQQFESGKLGMWVFLATEILMFGGLFCAYAIYRGNHPLTYLYGHHYLDTMWGAINTVILIASSFTMAWAVRAAQLGKQQLLVAMLVITLVGGCGFMVIKGIEYNAKFSHHLGPGKKNLFYGAATAAPDSEQMHHIHELEAEYGLSSHGGGHGAEHAAEGNSNKAAAHSTNGANAQNPSSTSAADNLPPTIAQSAIAAPHAAPGGMNLGEVEAERSIPLAPTAGGEPTDAHSPTTFASLPQSAKERVHIFFQTYFLMTGLHGLHVLIGMAVIAWLIVVAMKGRFGKEYFTPVEIGGLYWHLVDLIWIFLFPLLYLIH